DLLGLQPLALQHVEEIGIAAEVELVGVIEPHAAFAEQVGQHAMDYGGADLALDVVADNGQTRRGKAALPFGLGGDERGYAVDESTTGLERLLGIELRRPFRADRKVGYEHIYIGPAQFGSDVDNRRLCFLDHVVEIFA